MTSPKKRKMTSKTPSNDKLPEDLRHIRKSTRSIRPEYYIAYDKLKSTLHCTSNQAARAIIEVANGMFGCNWKYHDEELVVNLDIAPH